MGRMMLLLVVAVGVIFGLTSYSMMQANTRMTFNAVSEYARIQAKSLAESGVEYAIMMLAQDSSFCTATTLQAANGQMSIQLQNTYSRFPGGPNVGEWGKLVTSIGTYYDQSVTVKAVIQIPHSHEVPPWMKFALISDKDLDLGGDIYIMDDGNTAWNADVHTNEDLSANGSVLVEGFGSYVQYITLHPNVTTRFFVPNVNPANASVTRKVAQIPIPVFDPSAYIASATQVITGASTTLNANNLVLGTKENPEIIYVAGDLYLSGSFSGYGVFIVMGDVHVTGNVTTTSVDPLGNNLGFYSAKGIIFHGNAAATGQFFAKNDITFGGGNALHGMAVSKSAMLFQGSVNLYYRPASSNLTEPFWPGELLRPKIVSYYQ